MKLEQNIKIAVDAIVFGYNNHKLNVLLIKQKFGLLKDKWALIGGFIKNNETLNQAVNREIQEETGLKINYLEQLYTFGDDLNRDPRFHVISVAYFALVNSTNLNPIPNTDAQDAKWFDINDVPKLAFDHNYILKIAKERLQNKLTYKPIGFDLLQKEFLFSDLEKLYSTILEKQIDRRNFRKKILSFGIIEETEKFAEKSKGRPAKLFKFNYNKYKELEENGFIFEFDFI